MKTSVERSPQGPNASATALVGATIVDGNGGAPIIDGVVLIEGKRILGVGDRSTPIPSNAKQISVAGKFIIPGFIGSVQLVGDFWTAVTAVLYEGRFDELALEAAQVALKSGLTTVIDPYGPVDDLMNVRTAINEGRAIGSRIHLCGGWVGFGGVFSMDNNYRCDDALSPERRARINARWQHNIGQRLTFLAPQQVREEVRKYVETGIDYLFTLVNVHRYAGEAHRFFQFSPRVLRAIVEEAHRAGLVVQGNCMYSEEGVVDALEAGVDLPVLVTLKNPLSDEIVELLAERQVPWMIHPHTREESEWYAQHEKKLSPEDLTSSNALSLGATLANQQALLRAGVPVMLPMGGNNLSEETRNLPFLKAHIPPGSGRHLGSAHFTSMQGAQDIGMKPMAALQAATRNIARAYKIDESLGTLERGKFADLLVLDKDPLEDAGNYRSISTVMKDGKIIDRDVLPTQRLLTA